MSGSVCTAAAATPAGEGNFISGKNYVAALQRLKGESAQRMARKVGAFFWRDAPNIKVWLCRECEAELKL